MQTIRMGKNHCSMRNRMRGLNYLVELLGRDRQINEYGWALYWKQESASSISVSTDITFEKRLYRAEWQRYTEYN